MLKKFDKYAEKLIGIDPVIRNDDNFKKIKCIRSFFNQKIIKKYLNKDSDIIICGHTLEHVENVDQFIKDILSISNIKTKIFFPIPILRNANKK